MDKYRGRRFSRVRRIESLDPDVEYLEIFKLSTLDFERAHFMLGAELFMNPYSNPRISRTLTQTGELVYNAPKRAVDTLLLMKAMAEHGFDEGPGRDAVRIINRAHSRFDLHPEDLIFMACIEAVSFVRLAERFGWRPITDKERRAVAKFIVTRSTYMGIRGIPHTIEGMGEFCRQWMSENSRYAPENQKLANTILEFLVSTAPKQMRGGVRRLILGLLDDGVIQACGLDRVSKASKAVAYITAKGLGALGPGRDDSDPLAPLITQVYPNGAPSVQLMGPPAVKKAD
ncbi:oxygenase MpaB family protein [Streptomyces sp. NPDC048419]|uniref:oxygenase MpaB family protein n=1 Tax=Streptomyces sp. NPDC048419 TaxID=3365547 RepID=UPI00371F83D0